MGSLEELILWNVLDPSPLQEVLLGLRGSTILAEHSKSEKMSDTYSYPSLRNGSLETHAGMPM